VIDLSDLAHEDVQQVINFVYTGGLKLTSDNVIRITKVAKSLKIKVLEDICLNYITKSIEPVKNELFKVAPRTNSEEGIPGGNLSANPPGGSQSTQPVKIRTMNRPPKRSTPNEPSHSKVLRLSQPNASDPVLANPVTNPVTPGQSGSGIEKIQFGSPNPVTPRTSVSPHCFFMKRCTVANCLKCPPDRNNHSVNSPQFRNGTSPHGSQLGSVHHNLLPSSVGSASVGPAGHIGHHPIGSGIIEGSLSHQIHSPSGPSNGSTHGLTHGPPHRPSHGLPHAPPHGQTHLPIHRVRQSPTGLPPHSMHHQSLSNPRQNDTSFKPSYTPQSHLPPRLNAQSMYLGNQ